EEGNLLRLNDERVSRFHAKVQTDNGEIILTDLDSTNGTRVNGNVIQIRRLRPGDRIGVGRSLLLFGSDKEIAERVGTLTGAQTSAGGTPASYLPASVHAQTLAAAGLDPELAVDLNPRQAITKGKDGLYLGAYQLPDLPAKMSPSQAARLEGLLDFLHRHLTAATENIRASEDGVQVTLGFADWQRVLAVQMILARYVRAVTEPESLNE